MCYSRYPHFTRSTFCSKNEWKRICKQNQKAEKKAATAPVVAKKDQEKTGEAAEEELDARYGDVVTCPSALDCIGARLPVVGHSSFVEGYEAHRTRNPC